MSQNQQDNPYYRPVHRERKKISIPGFGGGKTFGRKGDNENRKDSGDIWMKFMPLIVLIFAAYAMYDTFSAFNKKDKNTVDEPKAIQAMEWKHAKVYKKFADITPRSKHFYLVIGYEGASKIIDFGQEKSEFWDQIDTYNFLTKAPGSLSVSVDAYDNSRDRVVDMKFD